MLTVRWRPHLREPHESAERGEQRPDTNGAAVLVTQDVLERVGLEIKLKAGDVVAHSSCERHTSDGINVLEVVGDTDAPRPAHSGRARPTEHVSIVIGIQRMPGGQTNGCIGCRT